LWTGGHGPLKVILALAGLNKNHQGKNMKKDNRVRHIGITWCNYPDNYLELLQSFSDSIKGNYFVIGHEIAPNTKTPHIQGYVQLSNRLDFKEILKRRPDSGIHINRCDGTVEDNINYCKKDDDWLEMGKPRLAIHGTKSSLDLWNECVDLARRGEVHEIEHVSSKYYVIYYNTWIKMSSDFSKGVFKEKLCIWIHGKSGVGKSRFCYENYPDAFSKQMLKWWDGYKGQKTVLIDDIDAETLSIRELKLVADRYPTQREVKGSAVFLCNELLLCTSNYSIGATFVNAPLEHVEAIKRRFIEVEAVQYNELLSDLTIYYDGKVTSLKALIQFMQKTLIVSEPSADADRTADDANLHAGREAGCESPHE
jgi:hypothetical protein